MPALIEIKDVVAGYGGAPILNVYGSGRAGPPERLEAAEGNRRFDQELAGFATMFSQPGSR